MSEAIPGSIVFADLTIPNADVVRDFYQEVLGWTADPIDMKDGEEKYADYIMKDSTGNGVGGVCHARGVNLGIPPVWILYVAVADVVASLDKCRALGGKVIREARNAEGILVYAIIEDPAGAVLAIAKA